MRAIAAYTKFEILGAMRIPMVYVTLLFMPVVGMLLFVLPAMGSDPAAATLSTASMCLFTVLIICSAQYGLGIADARTKPWGGYVRTLPGGFLPKMTSMIALSAMLVVLGSVPLIGVAALGTVATATPLQILAGLGALLVAVVPFSLMMLAIAYAVNPYLVGAVTSVLPIALAFLGGLFTDPNNQSAFFANVSPFFPTRGSVELVWAAVGGFTPNPISLIMLGVWTLALGWLAYRAYRRDEGRRFH
ncbi:ABC transporter permease [Spongiactinospora sp. TRM90649]|uniref:ABC transporter permease n=1 Tax=Spongiactinospora sp. TRM90649 TaxID=3031114 RepID=UPI0023F8F706|nr:ABC transporter permease [Spongiactinospora sp. TRM90649]MDF5759273.1 ABC transporter permease [Spongiactinospora sp. TRM90649]